MGDVITFEIAKRFERLVSLVTVLGHLTVLSFVWVFILQVLCERIIQTCFQIIISGR